MKTLTLRMHAEGLKQAWERLELTIFTKYVSPTFTSSPHESEQLGAGRQSYQLFLTSDKTRGMSVFPTHLQQNQLEKTLGFKRAKSCNNL